MKPSKKHGFCYRLMALSFFDLPVLSLNRPEKKLLPPFSLIAD
jgi:hypothetical protein